MYNHALIDHHTKECETILSVDCILVPYLIIILTLNLWIGWCNSKDNAKKIAIECAAQFEDIYALVTKYDNNFATSMTIP